MLIKKQKKEFLKTNKKQSHMEKTIEVDLKIKVEITKNNIDVKYDSTIDSDLAILAVSQYVLEMAAVGLREEKKNLSGKAKQLNSQASDRVIKGRNAIQVVLAHYIELYDDFIKSEMVNNQEMANSVTAQIDELIKKQEVVIAAKEKPSNE
jgi:hypothetical protein